jgi:hypothetical protein
MRILCKGNLPLKLLHLHKKNITVIVTEKQWTTIKETVAVAERPEMSDKILVLSGL